LRIKTDNKSGGQQGHVGSTLEMVEVAQKIVEYNHLMTCEQCNKALNTESLDFLERRQEVELPPVEPYVIEHRIYKKCCLTCGHINKTKFPEHLKSPIQFGLNIECLVAYLHVYQYVPFKRIVTMLKDLYGIEMSEGTIDNLLNRFDKRATPMYENIQSKIEQSNIVGADETGSKINSKKGWFHTWQNNKLTFIVATFNRGFETVQTYFPNGFINAVFVSDCWAAQLKTRCKAHQLCLVHLFRELNNFIDIFDNDWSKKLKALFKTAIELKKEMKPVDFEIKSKAVIDIQNQLTELLKIDETNYHKKLQAFIRRLRKHEASVFVFLEYYEAPYENNASERAIRNIKVKTKISGGFRSLIGAQRFAKIRSIIDTTIKNSQNVFEGLKGLHNVVPE
jgi:transposase